MKNRRVVFHSVALSVAVFLIGSLTLPELALAQAADPFSTGAQSLVTSLTTLLTPVAVVLVMALGVTAAAGQISWGWPIGVLVGIGVIFAAPSVVTWAKGLFGV
jgi:type IV secretory pathway VirB2 component (pilin)